MSGPPREGHHDDPRIGDAPWVVGSAEIETDEAQLAEARRHLLPLYTYVARRVASVEGMAGQRTDDARLARVIAAFGDR
jgi:hypothetical protein